MKLFLFVIAFLLSTHFLSSQTTEFLKTLDSIKLLRKLSDNESFNLNKQLEYAEKASELSYKTEVDSIILISNCRLINNHLYLNNVEMAKTIGLQNLKLAIKLKDSVSLTALYSNLGYIYQVSKSQNDSAYYYYNMAVKIGENNSNIHIKKTVINVFTNLSYLYKNKRNYLSSEEMLIKALSLAKSFPEGNYKLIILSDIYDSLGQNSSGQKAYSKSIDFFEKALLINNKVSETFDYWRYTSSTYTYKKTSYLYSNINLAEAYKNKKNYKKAISIYKEILKTDGPFNKDSLVQKDPTAYAAIRNNMAYNMFLDSTRNSNNNINKNIKTLFKEAYNISDSLDARYEIVAGGNDFSEFYMSINKKDSAKILAKRSLIIGREIKDFYEVSRSLMLLSKLEDGEKGKQYLYEHIKLNDSLLDVERASRNKFARIQFETDEYIDENKRLSVQNILISILGLIIIVIMVLIFIIRGQITKNERLKLEREQQKTNEEIYTLLMREQIKVEEGRLAERYSIAEELHDGVLNQLSGSRLALEYLASSGVNDKAQFLKYTEHIQNTENEIRQLSHNLRNTKLNADKDFINIVEDYIRQQLKFQHIKYDIRVKGKIIWQYIDDYVKVNLFRIIQEAVHNILKHANASHIQLEFIIRDAKIHLKVIDDGIGFEETEDVQEGIGLKNIKSRVLKLQGIFQITSNAKSGTTLEVMVPL